MGLWLIVWHLALEPHNVRQGSPHLYEMHARLKAHSALTVHSGRQFGGPATHWKSGKQVQTLVPSTTRHKLFGPHGEGSQGLLMALSPSKNCIVSRINHNCISLLTEQLQRTISIFRTQCNHTYFYWGAI